MRKWMHPLTALRRAPGLAGAVVTTLGVAIGAVVAFFAVFRAVLLEPLPYPHAEELVRLWETNPEVDSDLHGPSPLNVLDWRAGATRLEEVSAWFVTSAAYRGPFGVEQIRTAQVGDGFFEALGVEPALGRPFQVVPGQELGAVVLSHRAWRRLFGGDPAVVGAVIEADGRRHTVSGVMPEGFAFPDESIDVWMAWSLDAVYSGRPETRSWRFLGALGRLAPNATVDDAEVELDALAGVLAERHPEANDGWGVEVVSLRDDVVGEARAPLLVALVAVSFILLIACANVANLLLARVPGRVRELATRQALGASRGRLMRELLVEHLSLSALAGLLGVWFATFLLDLLVAVDAGRIPRLEEATIDPGVLLFAVGVTLVTGLVFGLVPSLRSLSAGAAEALRSGARAEPAGAGRTRELFVATQVAVTVVLLVGAGLFGASFARLVEQDPGLDTRGVATFRVALGEDAAGDGGTARYYEGLLDRIRDLPGVEAAGAAQTLPMHPVGNDFFRPYRAVGSETSAAGSSTVQMRIVTPGYAEAVGLRLLDGQAISEQARAGEPLVAMVNSTLAQRLWPRGGAVGSSFEIDFRGGWQPYRVVGVVGDVKHYGLRASVRPEVYLAHAQAPYLAMSVAVRTAGDPDAMTDALRAAVLAHVPAQPPHDFVSLAELAEASVADERFLSLLLGLLAVIGVGLATTGVYGVIAYTVGHRRREIGIRLALGARPGALVRSILLRALGVAGAGLGAGLVIALGLARSVEELLFGVSPYDPRAVGGAALLLLAAAAAAALLPARRAASVPPTEAMREA